MFVLCTVKSENTGGFENGWCILEYTNMLFQVVDCSSC